MLEVPRDIEPRPKYYRIPQIKGPDGERQLGQPVPVYGEALGQGRLSSPQESRIPLEKQDNSGREEITVFELTTSKL